MPKGASTKWQKPAIPFQGRKRVKNPTQLQKEALLSFMERHSNFACGRVNASNARLKWSCLLQKMADHVNEVDDGDKRDGAKWWKCWNDMKSNAKESAAVSAVRQISTGGGGPADETIDSMMDDKELEDMMQNQPLTTGDMWTDRIMAILGWNVALGTGLRDDLDTTMEFQSRPQPDHASTAKMSRGKAGSAVLGVGKENSQEEQARPSRPSRIGAMPCQEVSVNLSPNGCVTKRTSKTADPTEAIVVLNSSSESSGQSSLSPLSSWGIGGVADDYRNECMTSRLRTSSESCLTSLTSCGKAGGQTSDPFYKIQPSCSGLHRRSRPASECLSNDFFSNLERPTFQSLGSNILESGNAVFSGSSNHRIQGSESGSSGGSSLGGSSPHLSRPSHCSTPVPTPENPFEDRPPHVVRSSHVSPQLSLSDSNSYKSVSMGTQTATDIAQIDNASFHELIMTQKRTAESLERNTAAINKLMQFLTSNVSTIIFAPKEEVVAPSTSPGGVADVINTHHETATQNEEPALSPVGVADVTPVTATQDLVPSAEESAAPVALDMPDLGEAMQEDKNSEPEAVLKQLLQELGIDQAEG